ncbi:hypothetical protein PtB15_14B399 [Puccinia triticina]|nr:hypothetical protein PtB15_14B399 [Puccinia triticina]
MPCLGGAAGPHGPVHASYGVKIALRADPMSLGFTNPLAQEEPQRSCQKPPPGTGVLQPRSLSKARDKQSERASPAISMQVEFRRRFVWRAFMETTPAAMCPMRHSWWIALKDKCDALHHKPKRAKTPPPVNPPQTIVVTAPPPPTAYLVQPQPAVVYAQPAQVPAQAH